MNQIEKTPARIGFADFVLDVQAAELSRRGQRVTLTQRAFAVLAYLLSRPGVLVTRDELLSHVWSGRIVSEAALNKRIQEVRGALNDDARDPRLLETLPRRGYRFIGRLNEELVADAPAFPAVSSRLAGRERERALLRDALAKSLTEERQFILVRGDAGIGKTALVDDLVAAANTHVVGRGQCVDHFGYGEPRLPLLEAIAKLCRTVPDMRAVFLQQAPSWLAHLPGLLDDHEMDSVRERVNGVTSPFMLRELNDALDRASLVQPILLVLEDLHWADASTLAALSSLAWSRDPARLAVVVTLRSAFDDHESLTRTVAELQLHNLCRSVELPPLETADVLQWFEQRFAHDQSEPIAVLAGAVHEHCQGHPLFIQSVIDDLIANGTVQQSNGKWNVTLPIERCVLGVPETIALFIERQLSQSSAEQTRVLDAAAVLGTRFAHDDVEAMLGPDAHADGSLKELTARRLLLPDDGQMHCAFAHHLVQELILARMPTKLRGQLHLRAAKVLGAHAGTDAATLATHYEFAGEWQSAAENRLRAAESALLRSAHPEAVASFRRGLEHVQQLPESAASRRLELALQAGLGVSLVVTLGYSAPEAKHTFERARSLASDPSDSAHLFTAIHGLRNYQLLTANLEGAVAGDADLVHLARRTGSLAQDVWAQTLTAETLYQLGELRAATELLETVWKHFDERADSLRHAATWARPSAGILAYRALVYADSGRVDSAVRAIDEALQRPSIVNHPYSHAFVHYVASQVRVARLEYGDALQHIDVLRKIAGDYGFPFLEVWGELLHLYVHADVDGAGTDDVSHALACVARLDAMGIRLGRGTALSMCASIKAQAGDMPGCLELIDQGIAHARASRERLREVTLVSGRGLLMLRHRTGPMSDIESSLRAGATLASERGAKLQQLRALLGLTWCYQLKRSELPALLEEMRQLLATFSEGFEILDLRAARAFVDAPVPPAPMTA